MILDETSTSKSSVQKSDFKLLKVIGRGSYGKVYLVEHYMTGQVFAMKVVKKDLIIKTDQVAGIKGKSNEITDESSNFNLICSV